MKIEDAEIGATVIYRERDRPAEEGVVTSVNDRYVFVRYGADRGSKATSPESLEPLVRR